MTEAPARRAYCHQEDDDVTATALGRSVVTASVYVREEVVTANVYVREEGVVGVDDARPMTLAVTRGYDACRDIQDRRKRTRGEGDARSDLDAV